MPQNTKKRFSPLKAIFGLLIILLCFSWLNIRSGKGERSGIQITSNKDAGVEIDGVSVGKTPYYIENRDPGSVDVRITENKTGQTWKEKIKLIKGSITTVHRDFGDTEYRSSGYILNLEADTTGGTTLNIISTPKNCSIMIDGSPRGFTPLTSNITPGPHVFKFALPGFEDKEIHAEVPQGYKLEMIFSMASVDQPVAEKETVLTIGNNEVVITPNYITLNPELEMFDEKPLRIDQASFPLIFNVDKEFTRINAREFSGGGVPETKLIYISGQVPNHGTYADNYYVIIDPEINKVVEDGYNYLFGNVHLNNSCTSCALPGLFFSEYSKKDHSFVLTNNKHQKEFIGLLKQYEQFEQKATCQLNKKDYPLSEALKVSKATDRCADQNAGGSNLDAVNDSFITLGEYKQIVNNIKAIIRGENVMMFPRGYHGEGLSPLIRWITNDRGQTFTLPIDSKDNFFDQESIDSALGLSSIVSKLQN